MREPDPETESLEISEVKSQLVSLVHDVAQKQSRVLVEEDGAPVAALVSLADYRQLTRLDEQIAERRRVVEAIREAFRDVPPEELERETAKAVAEVRAEMRAERSRRALVIRATLDVNVLASGFQGKPGVPQALIDSWTNLAYELVLSEHILDGLIRTWRKPYFQRRIAPGYVLDVLALLRDEALIVVPSVAVHGVGEDEEDDLVLSTALTGAAEFLVTGDRHLQQIGDYEGLIILPPREFLEVLTRDVM